MSVINQMLKDLEQRQEQIQPGRYQPPAPMRRIWWRAWPALGLPLLAYGALWLWPRLVPVESVTPHGAAAPTVASAASAVSISMVPTTETKLAAVSSSVATAPSAAITLAHASTEHALSSAATTTSQAARDLSSAPSAAAPVSMAVAAAVSSPTAKAEAEPTASGEDNALAQASDDELLGPDLYAGRGASDAEVTQASVEPQGSLEIEEVRLSPSQMATLDRRKANQAIAKGDLEQARQALFRVLQQEPQDNDSRECLAGLLYGEERLAEARSLLEQGMALAPRYANFRLLLARVSLAMSDKPSALGYLNSLEPDVSRNLDYYATRAALAQELGQYASAAASYQQLSRVQPAEGRWWLGLAIAYDKQGRQLAAKDAYLKAQQARGLSAAALNFAQQRYAQLEQG